MVNSFRDSINFERNHLTTNGNDQSFITKFDTSGNVLWAKQFQSSSTSGTGSINSLCLDSVGHVFIVGDIP